MRMPRLIRRRVLFIALLSSTAVPAVSWPASVAGDVPAQVSFDPGTATPGTRVTIDYDPCYREGGRGPGPDHVFFSKSNNGPRPPYLGSAVLTLVKEGSAQWDGVTSFVVPDLPPGHYYLLAKCDGEEPCCELDGDEDMPWFAVPGAPNTDVAPMPSDRKREDPWLPVFLGAAAAAGSMAWRHRVGRSR